jgi:hypothetical protein
MNVTKEELLQCIFSSLKDSYPIRLKDVTSSPDWVKFEMGGDLFKVDIVGNVEKCEGGMLRSDLTTSLMKIILKNAVSDLKNA